MANRVVHFEIEGIDKEKLKKFYSETFGWKMEQMGEDFGNYVVITTGDPKEPGGINGGMFSPLTDKKEMNAFRCVIDVADAKKSMEDVKKAGGKILHGPDEIPGVGTYVWCTDPEGNHFSLLQPSPESMQK